MTRLALVAPANQPTHEPASAGIDRMLLLKLSEHRAAVLALTRIEAEIADLSRVWADARGLTLRPRIEQLRRELGA